MNLLELGFWLLLAASLAAGGAILLADQRSGAVVAAELAAVYALADDYRRQHCRSLPSSLALADLETRLGREVAVADKAAWRVRYHDPAVFDVVYSGADRRRQSELLRHRGYAAGAAVQEVHVPFTPATVEGGHRGRRTFTRMQAGVMPC